MKRRLQIDSGDEDDDDNDDKGVMGMDASMFGGGINQAVTKKKKKKNKKKQAKAPVGLVTIAPTPSPTIPSTSTPGFRIKVSHQELAKRQARAQRFEKPLDGVVPSPQTPPPQEPRGK